MKAFILIAGEGSRLRPLTKEVPKPMLPILNKPVLQYIVEHLASSGITEIMMNPGYRGEMIEQYFGDGLQFGVSITYLPEMIESKGGYQATPKGSGTSLATAEHFYQFFDQPVLVVCGDAIIDLDVRKAMTTHVKSSAMVSVLLQDIDASIAHKYGIAKLDPSGKINEFIEKPKSVKESRCLANTGVYIFNPNAIAKIPLQDGLDIGSDLLPKWVQQDELIMGINQPYQWLDIGTVEDYKKVNHFIHQRQASLKTLVSIFPKPRASLNSNEARDEPHLLPYQIKERELLHIGNGWLVDSGTEFSGNVIVGNNCVIEQDCSFENCIVGAYCRVPAGTRLVNSILTKSYLITFDKDGNWSKSIQLNSASSRSFFQSATEPQQWLSIA
jgi:mannose-1-phosphate guanylyltransferase